MDKTAGNMETFKSIMNKLESIERDRHVFAEAKNGLSTETKLYVVEEEQINTSEDGEEYILPGGKKKLDYVLSIADLQDIKRNIEGVNSKVTVEDFTRAVIHFLEHDAFIGR
jgi:hypothetical protein